MYSLGRCLHLLLSCMTSISSIGTRHRQSRKDDHVACSIGKNMDSNTADDHCCQQNYKLQYDLQVATSHGETVWDFQS